MAEAPAGTVRVGLVATFATWKGHDVFLDAAARVPADVPARFYVVGGPIYRTAGSQAAMGDLKAQGRSPGPRRPRRLHRPSARPRTGAAAGGSDVDSLHASTLLPRPFGRVIVEG